MSSRALFRNPTWRGLHPGLPVFSEAPAPLAQAIQEAIGSAGVVRVARFDQSAAPFARLDPDDGSPALFIKIVPAERASTLAESEELARWLAREGQPVNAALPDFPRDLDRGRVLVAYAYREGRRARPEERDLAALGESLATLHATLSRYPRRDRLERATDARFEMLLGVRADLASGRRRAGPDPDALERMAADAAVAFEGRVPGSTPIHDDLNSGNILMTRTVAGDVPFYLDFEDALHGVLPPRYDLVLVLERLVLVSEPDEARATELGTRLFAAYRRAAGRAAWSADGEALTACLRGRALRALCTLAACEWDRVEIAPDEWAKFFFLERQARERSAVLRRIGAAV